MYRLTLILALVSMLMGCIREAESGKASDLTLTNLEGRLVDPLDFSSAYRVFIFVRSDCPIANRYAPEIRRLSQRYRSGVEFVLIYPNGSESVEQIRAHLSEFDFSCPAYRDPEHALVRLTGARITPEAAVFSRAGELLYCGRIDDRYVSFGQARPEATVRDLEEVLENALSGNPVVFRRTAAVGCLISDVQAN